MGWKQALAAFRGLEITSSHDVRIILFLENGITIDDCRLEITSSHDVRIIKLAKTELYIDKSSRNYFLT